VDELRRRYADILIGPVRARHGVALAAVAPLKTDGCGSFRHGAAFADHPWLKELAPQVWRWARRQQDAPWVRGRLERLFRVPAAAAADQGEKCCFNHYLAAAVPNDDGSFTTVVFICCDYYGASEILFEEPAPHAEPRIAPDVRRRLAAALWDLVLEDPADVPEYTDRLCHAGAGVWIRFGIRRGRPFMIEEPA
jgi:hypothetical protein